MPAAARHISGLSLPASHSTRPLDDFDLQFIATFRLNRLETPAQNGALRKLVPQTDSRRLLKTSDDHAVDFTRRDQNLDVRGHTPLFTDNGSLGHVENFVHCANMVEPYRQILWR